MKNCIKCGENKTLSDFTVRSGGSLRNECKDCTAKWQREYRKNNKSKIRKQSTVRRYGLSEEQYNEIETKKNCEICGVILVNSIRESNSKNIDHCHSTGAVRGVLCFHCNTAIGLFKDEVKLLRKAIKYLNR